MSNGVFLKEFMAAGLIESEGNDAIKNAIQSFGGRPYGEAADKTTVSVKQSGQKFDCN